MANTYTLLIVDDNFDDRFILKRYFQKTGLSLKILEAGSGPDAIELLTTPLDNLRSQYPGISSPVTLFLDIHMPGMDGWQFVEELDRRHEDKQISTSIVLMYSTSVDAEYKKEKALAYSSIDNYIIKGESTPENFKQAILSSHMQAK